MWEKVDQEGKNVNHLKTFKLITMERLAYLSIFCVQLMWCGVGGDKYASPPGCAYMVLGLASYIIGYVVYSNSCFSCLKYNINI